MNSTPEGLPVRLSTTAIPVGSAAAGDATATAPARARVTSPTRPIFPAEKRANAMVVVAMTGLPIVYRLAAGLSCLPFRAPSWAGDVEVHHKEQVAWSQAAQMSLHTHKVCAPMIVGAAAVGANTALFHGRRRGGSGAPWYAKPASVRSQAREIDCQA